MTPDQYRELQNQINRPVAAQVIGLLRAATLVTDSQWLRLGLVVYDLVSTQRSVSTQLARAYYASLAPSGRTPPVPAPDYTAEMTQKSLGRVQQSWTDATAPQRAELAARGAAIAVRHVEQAGRETVVQATREDGAKWARYDSKPPCCSWCTLMISRGPVYLSAETGGFLAHDFDTCSVEPVFPGRDWHGRKQYEAANAFYTEHAAGSQDQVKALRRAIGELGSPI